MAARNTWCEASGCTRTGPDGGPRRIGVRWLDPLTRLVLRMSDLVAENQRLREALASLIAVVDSLDDDVLERRVTIPDAPIFERLFDTADRALRVLQGVDRTADHS